MNYTCIIPARGDSKRIPRKNLQEVGGIPLIGHVIKNTLASNIFDQIYFSTDSDEIARIAVDFGAKASDRSSANLSDDYTPTRPVIADFIKNRPELDNDASVIACIYPFAIFTNPSLIHLAKNSFEKLHD